VATACLWEFSDGTATFPGTQVLLPMFQFLGMNPADWTTSPLAK
jgi:hypothetical protein